MAKDFSSVAAIDIASNNVYKDKKRHIRMRHGMMKEMLSKRVVSLDFLRSEKNLVDPFTKGLARRQVQDFCTTVGVNSSGR